MAEPQYKRGAGGNPVDTPLEQGQATALNEATPPPQEAPAAASAPSDVPDFGAFQPPQPQMRPSTDEEKFLLAPPDGNQATAPSQLALSQVPDWLPLLQQAAADPEAPPQVRDLLDAIVFHLPGQ